MLKRISTRLLSSISAASLAATLLMSPSVLPSAFASHDGPPPLHVVGIHIETMDGKVVNLHGVNTSCLEFTSDGEGHILKTVATAIDDWHANLIRLPLSQDRWFGKAPEQKDGGASYRALVKAVVGEVHKKNAYVILDLHWSDMNVWGKNIGQHKLPDTNSLIFWKDFAPNYANNPSVLFDLYNEPHDTTWDEWKNGAMITEADRRAGTSTTYQAAGMQQVLDTIRATGAKNICVCGGLNWAYDMTGYLHGYTLSDPNGNGVIYSNHFYTVKGETIDQWVGEMEAVDQQIPVIESEFGDNTPRSRGRQSPLIAPAGYRGRQNQQQADAYDWNKGVITQIQAHNWSWSAWDMHTSAGPVVISDWNYTPTPEFGALVKATLAGDPLPPHPASATIAQVNPVTDTDTSASYTIHTDRAIKSGDTISVIRVGDVSMSVEAGSNGNPWFVASKTGTSDQDVAKAMEAWKLETAYLLNPVPTAPPPGGGFPVFQFANNPTWHAGSISIASDIPVVVDPMISVFGFASGAYPCASSTDQSWSQQSVQARTTDGNVRVPATGMVHTSDGSAEQIFASTIVANQDIAATGN